MFVQALAWAGARLFAGVSDASGAVSLLESNDSGSTFSRVVSLCDVAPAIECNRESTVGATCTGDTEAQVSLNAEALPWCASTPPPSPPPSGAPAPKAEPEAGSCSLGQPPSARSGLVGLLAASLLLLGVASRRSGAPHRRFSAGRAAARALRPRARPRT
jgi:hypothetical protein